MRSLWFDIELAALRQRRRIGRSAAAIAPVLVASAAVFFILSLGNGLHEYLSERLRQFTPALWVEGAHLGGEEPSIRRTLESIPGVGALSPVVEATVLISHNDSGAGAVIAGYDLDVLETVVPGSNRTVAGHRPSNAGEVALGIELARTLGASLGDDIRLTGPAGDVRLLRLVGVYRAGFAAVDAALAVTDFETAARITQNAGRYGYALAVLPGADLDALRLDIQAQTGRWTRPWHEGRQALLEAIDVESRVMFWITLAAVAAAALGSAGIAVFRVVERRSESGILLALGASPMRLLVTTLAESAAGAVIGSVGGAALGWAAVWLLGKHPIRLPSEYGLEYLPLVPSWADFALAAVLTVAATSVASLAPALQAARTDPAQVLRER